MNIIKVKNLVKKYGNLIAVNNISFDVVKGEVFGLLGENGAGKTTTLEMIEGLRKPTSGEITILGHDYKEQKEIKEKIGVQLQSSAYYDFLTLEEILNLFSSFYGKNLDPDQLLKMVDLLPKKNAFIKNLSGGQKQRFSIVASLINDPEIVFLDEPTTGLDPLARRSLWNLITDIKKQGKTIILTTHYMEEAEMLCDRIAIMERGQIIAMGETHKLIEKAKDPYKAEFILQKFETKFIEKLKKIGGVEEASGKKNHYVSRFDSQKKLNEAIGLIQKAEPESLVVSKASLEDLFIELTGRTIIEEENA